MTFKKYFIPFFYITIILHLFSCSTAGDDAAPLIQYDAQEQREDLIDKLIREERPEEAIQWIHFYRQDNSHEIDFELRETEALALMTESFRKALEGKDFLKAISLYQSLARLEKLALLENFGETLETLRLSYILYLTEIGRTGAAAGLVSSEFASISELEEGDLQRLVKKFTEGENRKALSILTEEMESRSLPVPENSQEFMGRKVQMEDFLEGTVTIWVDKGLRIEKGVGYPDRVIGSGFFIDKAGYILTNYHVIESEVDPEYQGHSKLFIKLSDDRGEKIPARVVGWDRHFDLALLKTEIEAPYVFSFSSNNRYSLGQSIMAIGSPGGLNNSITSGTVSAVNRPLMTMGETVQIDVPINPGNSGGPLLNPQGEVKGVIFAGIEEFEGINFAIYGSYVKSLLPALYKGGAVSHPWIGIGGYQEYDHLEVLYTVPDSPADAAGMERGAKILSINGIEVKRNQDVRDIILGFRTGTIITLKWEIHGEEKVSFITLAERPDIPFAYAIENDDRESLIPALFGMVLERTRKDQYQVRKVYTGSAADEASISANDVITLKKWLVNEEDGYVLIQFLFKGVKAGYLESAIQLGAGFESVIFF